jgi:hypothetical protein
MLQMLLYTAPAFGKMDPSQQLLMEDRMKRWIIRKEFINKNEHDAPEDIKYILAYYAILLTIHQEDYLFKKTDRIVFYHHPFLTPGHEDDAHILEVESEDGTIILSVAHVLKGHAEKGYYNLALHGMAEAFNQEYVNETIRWSEDIWERLEAASTISKQTIEDYIGLPVEDPFPVCVHHMLTYQMVVPELQTIFPQFRQGQAM